VGLGGAALLARIVPGLEARTPASVVVAAVAMAFFVGVGAGVGPALRATSLDPAESLRAE
jgi:putative ABC transport system permease protein